MLSMQAARLSKCVIDIGLTCALIVITGCAYAEVRPSRTTDEKGIRFYRPWPYLWVMRAKEGNGCTLSVQYLPGTSQEYINIPHPGIGSLQANPTLEQGWNLVAMNIAADSKVAELVTVLAGMTGTIANAAIMPLAPQPKTEFGPGLYRLEFRDGKVFDLTEVFHLEGDPGNVVGCG